MTRSSSARREPQGPEAAGALREQVPRAGCRCHSQAASAHETRFRCLLTSPEMTSKTGPAR